MARQHGIDPDGGTAHVYAMGEGGPGAELHVLERPDLPPARQGAGGEQAAAAIRFHGDSIAGRLAETSAATTGGEQDLVPI